MQIFGQFFDDKDLDVTPQLAQIKAWNPQALLGGTTGKPLGIIVKNFVQMGFKIPFFVGAGSLSQSFLDMIAGNEPELLLIPGSKFVIYQSIQDSDPLKPIMKRFADDFKKKFNKEADVFAATGYDAARVFAEAIKAVNPKGPEDSGKLRAYIEKMKNFPGVFGAYYNFSPQDHRGLDKAAYVFVQAKNNKFVAFER
jgi:branched-chain amino acid transport system substrate-binding protein